MSRGGKRTTSFTKATAPKKKKGTKNRRTVVKQAIGIENWNQLQNWLETTGIQKATKELHKLKGRAYIMAYEALLEYVKPKLQRTTLVGDPKQPISTIDLSSFTFEQLKELIGKDDE